MKPLDRIAELQAELKTLDKQRELLIQEIQAELIVSSEAKIKELFLKNPHYQQIHWFVQGDDDLIFFEHIDTSNEAIYEDTEDPLEQQNVKEINLLVESFDGTAWAKKYGKGHLISSREGTHLAGW